MTAGSGWASLQSIAAGGAFGPVGLGIATGLVVVDGVAGLVIANRKKDKETDEDPSNEQQV